MPNDRGVQPREKQNNVFETITDAFISLDKEWRFSYINKQAELLLGRGRDELVGENIFETFPDSLKSRGYTESMRALEQNIPVQYEQYSEPLNRWFSTHIYPVPEGIVVYFKDITEHKRSEERNQYLAMLLESISDAVISIDLQMRVVSWNRGAERLYGWTASEATGKDFNELVPTEYVHRDQQQAFEQILKRGKWRDELIQTCKDGNRINVLSSATTIRDHNNTVIGIVAVNRDITHRKQAEEALGRLAAIVDSSADAIIGMKADGTVTSWNKRAEVLYGWSEMEMIGRNIASIVPQDRQDEIQSLIGSIGRGERVENFETARLRKNGTPVSVSLSISPIADSEGTIIGASTIARDITERKIVEQRREEQARQQRAVMGLGMLALASENIQEVLDQAVQLLTETLQAEYAKVLELLPERSEFVIRAGVGWDADVHVGTTTVSADSSSQVGYTLSQHDAVVVGNLDEETRFRGSALLRRHGIKSGISTVINLKGEVYGAISVHSSHPRAFSADDVQFLQIIANIVGMALERHYSEHALRESEERFKRLADDAPVLIWMTLDRSRIYFNRTWLAFTGHSLEEERGDGWLQGIHAEDLRRYLSTYYAALEKQERFSTEYRLRRADGEYRWMLETGSPRFTAEGEFLGYIGSCMDITEHKESVETIRYQALHDPLTALPNRKALEERLTRALHEAKVHEQMIAVMFLDIDNFKQVNDNYGHTAGDLVLKEMGTRFRSCVRDEDTVARLGGDEFIIMLSHVYSIDDVLQVAERIMRTMETNVTVGQHSIPVTTSIGITLHPMDGDDIGKLLKNADRALYRAKEAGKNRYHVYNRAVDKQIAERFTLENELREGIRRGELVLHYQPIIHTQNKRIVGVEALVRWNHPRLGLIYPNEFIPAAEAMGLIVPLGEWVLREACRQNKEWQDRGLPDFSVAVNLSAYQFAEPDLVAMVKDILTETGLSASCLELEITESVAMGNLDHTITTLRELAAMGVHITLDDFGTGYSSLSYLKRFPVHNIKIDQSFIRNCLEDEQDAAIVKTIITMAYSLGLKVIAEGVEREEQAAFLHTLNSHRLQGYLIQRPVPAEQLEQWVRKEMESWQSR